MPTIDVTDAAQRLLANKTVTPGHCLEYVSRAIRNGEPPLDWDGLDTALDCWNNGCGDKHTSRNIPRGFPGFLGAKRDDDDGDTFISLGDGRLAVTDYPRWGVVGICTLEQREAQTGRKYLGYAGEFLGYTLTNTTTASLGITPITIGKKNSMKVTWDTNGTGYLITEDGFTPLPDMRYYNLFVRLINSTPEAPDRFNPTEVDMMNSILRGVATSTNTQAAPTIDAAAIAKVVADQVRAQLGDVKVTIDEAAIAKAVNDDAAKRLAQ